MSPVRPAAGGASRHPHPGGRHSRHPVPRPAAHRQRRPDVRRLLCRRRPGVHGEESRPCGVCPACRKVLAGIHPDVITVRDPDHKNIAVDVVRAIRADAYIRPNEGRRKVYVFPDCALLTEQDQNVLLKVVEEGAAPMRPFSSVRKMPLWCSRPCAPGAWS
ncbi:MAG: hypothetical protein ACLTG0_08955 [Oscillibacter sp.]